MTDRRLHLVVAGAATAYLANRAGGFFPGATALVAAALVVALVLQITVARSPLAGWGRSAAVVGVAGGLLTSWTLASLLWSDAPLRAAVEFDRALLYLLAFAFTATFGRRPGDLAVLLRWVLLAMVGTAIIGLATRLYPDVFVAVAGRQPSRLAYPLTYWNAMSVFCALGAVLALHVASGEREPVVARILAGAALPILALAGYFPFSRGGIATAALGLAAYAVLARPRRLIFTLITAGPAVTVALARAYGASALATNEYASPPGPEQGHHVALVLALAAGGAALSRVLLLPLERRLDALRTRPALRRGLAFGLAAGVVALVVAALAAGAPERVRDQYRAFVKGNVVQETTDTRQRLTATGNNGRLDFWRVDRDAFTSAPLHGTGAGTFQLEWERRRPGDILAVDGHSLYLETLAELGVVGLALLLVVLGGILFALARLLAGPDRHAAAATLAAGGALLLHAGIDWDWEMPALFIWFFLAGGVACARAVDAARGEDPGRLARVLAGVGCLVLAIVPVLVTVSQARVQSAERAFARGDCDTAIDASLDSLGTLSVRPEPFELLGYCDLRARRPDLAVRAFRAARERDPDNWRYAYGLAVAQALNGEDPRQSAARAVQLNPRDDRARGLARALDSDSPARRRRAATRAKLPF